MARMQQYRLFIMMSPMGVSPLSKSSALPVKKPPASWTMTIPAYGTSSEFILDCGTRKLTQTSQAYGPASLLTFSDSVRNVSKRYHVPVDVDASCGNRYQRCSRCSRRPNTMNHGSPHRSVSRQPRNGGQLWVNGRFRPVASP